MRSIESSFPNPLNRSKPYALVFGSAAMFIATRVAVEGISIASNAKRPQAAGRNTRRIDRRPARSEPSETTGCVSEKRVDRVLKQARQEKKGVIGNRNRHIQKVPSNNLLNVIAESFRFALNRWA